MAYDCRLGRRVWGLGLASWHPGVLDGGSGFQQVSPSLPEQSVDGVKSKGFSQKGPMLF